MRQNGNREIHRKQLKRGGRSGGRCIWAPDFMVTFYYGNDLIWVQLKKTPKNDLHDFLFYIPCMYPQIY
jgi:hypothetical protein